MAWTETTRKIYARKASRYASDVTDSEWELISAHLPLPRRLGRPRTADLREVMNAILDYRIFVKSIRTIVMGRGTYEFIAKDPSPWAYEEQRVIVVTSRPIDNPKGSFEIRANVDDLIAELRALDDGDVWMMGGGMLQMTFMERGALDEIEIYVIPELLGAGRPLFPPTDFRSSPELISAKTLDKGCVRLHYRLS